jgi:hypothetical protein
VVAGTAPRFRLNFFLTTDGTLQPGSMLLGARDVDRLAARLHVERGRPR